MTEDPAPEPSPGDGGGRAARVGLWVGPLAFLIVLAWPGLPLDPPQRRVAAVTVLTATWWITVAIPIGATSLLPAALLPLLGVQSAREVAPNYMQDLVLLFLGAFVVALGLERWNVHRRMALRIISLLGSRPPNVVLGFMLASAFLSLWINNTSTTLLMLPIGLAVVATLGGERARSGPFATALLLGMAYSASMGGVATPVGTAPNQVFLGQFRERFPDAPPISFGQWTLAWLPLVLLFVPLAWLLLTRVLLRVPADALAGRDVIAAERARLGPMTTAERRMAAVFALTAVLWVARVDLELGQVTIPGWLPLVLSSSIAAPETFVTDATVATAMAVACFLIPAGTGDGRRLMDWRTASRMPWEVLLLIGGGFAIAGAFQASELDAVLGRHLGAALGGWPDWLIVLAVVAFMAALTEVTSNTATTAVLLPVLGQAAIGAGVSPLLIMAPATVAASAAFMLPVATPPNAVVFSSRLVAAPTMARVGVWLNLLTAPLITLVFLLWVRRVFGIEGGIPPWAGGGG